MKKLLLLTAILVLPAHAAGYTAEELYGEGAIRWEGSGHYYFFYYGDPVTRYEASDRCLLRGMFLASITDQEEQIFINSFRISHGDVGCWIGLQRPCSVCDWLWDDGTPFCPVDPDCYWGFYGNEGHETTEEYFVSMETWGSNNSGLWESTGNGVPVLKPCFVCKVPNAPPVADAGEDRSVVKGTLVTLDGSDSSDPNGDEPLIFAWEITDRPAGSAAVLDDPHSAMPSFTPDVAGSYEITLVVRDTYLAASDPDRVTIQALSHEPMVEALIQEVKESADLSEATKHSLVASLLAAWKALEDSDPENDVAAANALGAFVNKLEAQRGKKIPSELAAYLIERAQDILTVLGGDT